MSSSKVFYNIQNNKAQKILELEEGEFPSAKDESYFISSEIKDDKVIVYKYKDYKNKSKENILATYVYQNDKFVKE